MNDYNIEGLRADLAAVTEAMRQEKGKPGAKVKARWRQRILDFCKERGIEL